jgi:hypothetical protein
MWFLTCTNYCHSSALCFFWCVFVLYFTLPSLAVLWCKKWWTGFVSQCWQAMTHELASGDFLALEVADLCDPGVCPVNAFREFCGPSDPCMAHALRPHTLRAEFGINKVPYQPHSLHVSAMIHQLTLTMSMYLSIVLPMSLCWSQGASFLQSFSGSVVCGAKLSEGFQGNSVIYACWRDLGESLLIELGCSLQVKNAVHCTDIPEDGEIEVQHIFKHLWVY